MNTFTCTCCGNNIEIEVWQLASTKPARNMVTCWNEQCPAYAKTTTVEGWEGMLKRFGIKEKST